MLTYLVVPLFFMADYMASEETLAAGVKGYQQRAEAVRKQAIAEAESQAKSCAAYLSAAKKGRIDPKLVGTREAAAKVANGVFSFGTADDKAKQVILLERESGLWRDMAAGLKSRKIVPQLLMFFDGITPGAAGVFRWRAFQVTEIIDRDTCRVDGKQCRVIVDDGEPRLERSNGFAPSFLLHHNGSASAVDGREVEFPGVYQFVGVKSGCPVFRHIDELKIGEMEFVFWKSDGGEYHQLPPMARD